MNKQDKSEHELLLEDAFWKQFRTDLALVSARLIIQSGFIANRRVRHFVELVRPLVQRNVQICIFLQRPDYWDVPRERLSVDLSASLQAVADNIEILHKIGAHVSLISKVHMKFAILDESVFYEGSLNILSHNNTLEGMRRFSSVSETRKKIRQERFLQCSSCDTSKSERSFNDAPGQICGNRRDSLLTQNELAKKANLNQSQIARLESGYDVRLSTLYKICKQLGLDLVLIPENASPAVANLLRRYHQHGLLSNLDVANLTPLNQEAGPDYDFAPPNRASVVRESETSIYCDLVDHFQLPLGCDELQVRPYSDECEARNPIE